MKTIFKEGDRVFVYGYGWGKYQLESIINNRHLVQFKEEYFTVHNDLISFTEYTLEGFSQERPVTFKKDEAVAVSNDEWIWQIRHYSHDNRVFCDGLTSEQTSKTIHWKHIKKLTDFNK